jgi:hypothetical protein
MPASLEFRSHSSGSIIAAAAMALSLPSAVINSAPLKRLKFAV